MFMERGIGLPTVAEFFWFYFVKGNKHYEGFYYVAKRPSKELQAVTKIRESLGPWKESYPFTPEVQVKGTFGRARK